MVKGISIAWVTRSFLDYRLPVFEKLNHLIGGNLVVIFSGDYVPDHVQKKIKNILSDNAIGMTGEWRIGAEDQYFMANRNISIRLQPGLIKKIKEIEPDVLICDGFFKWTLPCLVYRFLHRVPIVINYERTFHTERKVQWYRTLYRRAVVKLTDAMDCNGVLCAEYTKSLGMPSARITLGHMSADTCELSRKVKNVSNKTRSELTEKLGLVGIKFIFVGRLAPRKGCKELLEEWAVFERKYPDNTLVFVGEGEQENELKEACDRLQIANVRFVGRVSYEEIYVYYSISDILIMPTLEDNWSLVVPEAMACGLPILCSCYNGCWPELVHDGENGWVFDPKDKGDLLRVLELCVSNRKKLQSFGEKSLEIVENFGPDNAAESILKACNIALNRRQ